MIRVVMNLESTLGAPYKKLECERIESVMLCSSATHDTTTKQPLSLITTSDFATNRCSGYVRFDFYFLMFGT